MGNVVKSILFTLDIDRSWRVCYFFSFIKLNFPCICLRMYKVISSNYDRLDKTCIRRGSWLSVDRIDRQVTNISEIALKSSQSPYWLMIWKMIIENPRGFGMFLTQIKTACLFHVLLIWFFSHVTLPGDRMKRIILMRFCSFLYIFMLLYNDHSYSFY